MLNYLRRPPPTPFFRPLVCVVEQLARPSVVLGLSVLCGCSSVALLFMAPPFTPFTVSQILKQC